MTMLVLCIQPDAFNNNDDNLFSHDARVHSKPNTDGWWACIAHSNDAACSCWRKNPFYAPHLPSAHSRKWRKCITHVNGTACKRSRATQTERMALVPVWWVNSRVSGQQQMLKASRRREKIVLFLYWSAMHATWRRTYTHRRRCHCAMCNVHVCDVCAVVEQKAGAKL